METIEKYSDQIFGYAVQYGGQALMALAVLIIGLWIWSFKQST